MSAQSRTRRYSGLAEDPWGVWDAAAFWEQYFRSVITDRTPEYIRGVGELVADATVVPP